MQITITFKAFLSVQKYSKCPLIFSVLKDTSLKSEFSSVSIIQPHYSFLSYSRMLHIYSWRYKQSLLRIQYTMFQLGIIFEVCVLMFLRKVLSNSLFFTDLIF
ncbi:hypothetical protein HHI36_021090 [Cryptolaemus montrouzieri]|uniref:Uncharacterized protein n=1 Tax=Cryptolaemus montrouzieri TaxID=559131 RepID=A0ABD2MWR3_9CUCU